jgi:glyceraldehyde-3-phosphate dehydrogenase (NADP+)
MMSLPQYPNLIGGEASTAGAPVTITNPFDDAPLGVVFNAASDDAERAIDCAARSFDTTRRMPAHARKAVLVNIAHRLDERSDEFAHLLCLETGKPIALARAEIARAVETLTLCAEEAGRIAGEFIPFDGSPNAVGRYGITRRFPVGPVLAITPFNFPINLLAHKVGPAIAVGAPVIHKPCVQAPLTAFEFAKLVYESGLPPEAYSAVYCEPDIAQMFVTDDRIKVLSFTGSDAVGWKLKSIAGKKRVLLELGGSASCIVEPDTPDFDFALSRCVTGAFNYAGQVCISIQRLMLHDSIYDDFTARFVERTQALKCGDPMDETTDMPPVIDDAAADRIERWVMNAVSAGARVLTGERIGKRMFRPYVVEDVPDGTELGCNEAFGPVVALYRYRDFDDAIALTNKSRYGLQTGVFTSNINKAFKAFERIDTGGLIVNDIPTWRTDAMPYGGVKDSGVGREGPRYAIEEMTEIRTMVVGV